MGKLYFKIKLKFPKITSKSTHTHTHTHTHTYVYIYICMCVRVRACMCVCIYVSPHISIGRLPKLFYVYFLGNFDF